MQRQNSHFELLVRVGGMQEDLLDIFYKLVKVVVVCDSSQHCKEVQLHINTQSTYFHS